MRKFLTIILIFTCLSVHSKHNFTDIKDEVNEWIQSIMFDCGESTHKPISINYAKQNYSICGIVKKGILSDHTIVKFYDTSALAPELILEGMVEYNSGRLVVKGVKYIKSPTGTQKIYGTFYVYNMNDFTLSYKPKKAGDLKIIRDKTYYLEGNFIDRAAIVRMDNNNTIYLDRKKEGNSFIFFSADIPNVSFNDDDSFDTYQMLLQTRDNVTMCWEDGSIFKGSIKPMPLDNTIRFILLDGQRSELSSNIKTSTLGHNNGNIVFSQDYNDNNTFLSNQTWIIKDDGNILENDLWNSIKLLEHCYLSIWTYRDGKCFEGKMSYDIIPNEDGYPSAITTTATQGVLTYPNGDRFEGDLSTKKVGPFFVDGTTFFADGHKANGNWLANFELDNNQWGKVYSCSNPSEAKSIAEKLMYKNQYPEYQYPGDIWYFEPTLEMSWIAPTKHIVYDKARNQYIVKDDNGKETKIVFTIDNKGYHNWEIIYYNGSPEYFNEFKWYPNGVIQSIKTYNYATKKIYLSLNFFSDGKLRSAYQYGLSNTGEVILRKSKESNPTFGGYTCKLFDLNGNYERSIEWNIGIGKDFYGGTYEKKMTPNKFIISKLEPIEDL